MIPANHKEIIKSLGEPFSRCELKFDYWGYQIWQSGIKKVAYILRRYLDAFTHLRICPMTSRAIFLSFISVACTGLTLAAISLPRLKYSVFWCSGQGKIEEFLTTNSTNTHEK